MPTPLRVAVVARAVMPLHGVGGLERSVHDLVRHLAAEDVEITLITPPPTDVRRYPIDPFSSPRIQIRHVSYLTFPLANRRGTTILDRSTAYPVFGWRAGRQAHAITDRREIDIVHGFGASALGYALARRRAAPLVFNPQGLEEFGATATSWPVGKRIGYWPLRMAVRACSRRADIVVATDKALEPVVKTHLPVLSERIRTIPNGIDLIATDGLGGAADGRLIRDRHGIAAGETVLLSVARLEQNKGLDVLVQALARAAGPEGALARHGWRWLVAGTGPLKPDLERAVDRAGIGRHVVFLGRAEDDELHAWYEAATLFVHPTLYEGSSLVTLEAMAHRKPVVATTAGGLPDKVRPGLNGWLIPPGDDRALAAAISDALSDPVRLLAMGARSRRIVEEEFAWSALVKRYLDLYRELLRRPVPPIQSTA
jgi:glycosyltransferase involved in cell wall biosynthesis